MWTRAWPLLLWLFLIDPVSAQIVVVPAAKAPPLERYAARELDHFLGAITAQRVSIGTLDQPADGYVLVGTWKATPADLRPQETFVRSVRANDRPAIVVSGGDPNGVLYAAYSLLEYYGYIFDFSGDIAPPRRPRLDLAGLRLREKPRTAERGLRLHLNFPMDPSSYSEAEWMAWVDRVARLKLNYLALHFYADQPWLSFTYRGVAATDGDFFSGRRVIGSDYLLPPGLPGRGEIENRKRYYPPDLEQSDGGEELYARAQSRIRAVIDHAHARGIRCAVSIEPLAPARAIQAHFAQWVHDFASPDALVQDVATRRFLALLDAYPQADEYQLISVEGSDDGPRDAGEQDALFARLRARYGLRDVLPVDAADGEEAQTDGGSTDTSTAAGHGGLQVASTLRFVDVARQILDDPRVASRLSRNGKKSSIAIYLPRPPALRAALPAIREMLAPGTRLHLLPAYGARGVARQMTTWASLRGAALQLGVITWLEFDGGMFLPQLWTRALYDAAAEAPSLPAATLYANVWRLGGLEADAYVFARAAWREDLSYGYIMDEYLGRLYGIDALPRARAAYAALEAATLYTGRNLPNVGFCWAGYAYAPYAPEHLKEARARFTRAAKLFTRLAHASGRAAARSRARYLANRCSCAVLHLKAIDALSHALAAKRDGDAAAVQTNARRAQRLGCDYLRKYSSFVRDRGDQGMLVSYYYAVVWRAARLRRAPSADAAEPGSQPLPSCPAPESARS